ncbi:large subunit ribosomal protein L17 [Balneicella halophila]|uniref:Large ribosomal subunit protein bL17 n=1 Tax=Balneicella halophila TaxID=1537566 RepID=A0A7L4URL9_BALHA|nr:large subunit ribosomal protein L17 [Balneicella halophila]
MRHRKKFNHLGRKAAHRKAMLANMASSLILHKRIKTTEAKAKALRIYVEPLVNKAKLSVTVKTDKMDATHLRRTVFSYLKQKEAVTELFKEVAPKVVNRPGGYTRIIKLGKRMGDNAEMAFIELVDFNELLLQPAEKPAKKKTRRRRSKKSETAENNTAPKTQEASKTQKEAPKADKEVKADDLTKIEGIGPKTSEALQNAGVTSFATLAEMEAEKISEILEAADGNFKAQVPDTWPEQAKLAADGKWDELKKWQDELDGGRVE